MKLAHTPGPWMLKRHATNHQTLTGAAPGLIADIHNDADAALIAAAPELLEALKAMVNYGNLGAYERAAAMQAARAAIAKAGGAA